MSPILQGVIIFVCLFALIVIHWMYEAKKADKKNQDKEIEKKTREFWKGVTFNDDFMDSERIFIGEEQNN